MNFDRMDEYQPWVCVALWGQNGSNYFTHASVKKPANDQPHGYDWESKGGISYDRFFHPKDALVGYGEIQHYYMKSGYSFGVPPTKKAAYVFKTADLTNDELYLMNQMVEAFSDKTRFEKLYKSWKNTWDDPELIIHSNPRMYAKSKHYNILLDYCENIGKEVWPLFFKKFMKGEELNMLLIEDLTKEKYTWKMNYILRQQNAECARNGTVPSQRVNYVYYIAALLGELEKEFEREQKSNTITSVLTFDQNQLINLYPNPAGNSINIKIVGLLQTDVVIKICDLSGKVLKSISKNMMGDHTFNINIEDILEGTYICKIESDNAVRITKFNVIK